MNMNKFTVEYVAFVYIDRDRKIRNPTDDFRLIGVGECVLKFREQKSVTGEKYLVSKQGVE